MRVLFCILVGFLAVSGVGASVFHYLREPYNPGFLEFPIITALHVVLGAVYLALAPFQFVNRIRSRWLSYHRYAGRLLVMVGLGVGASALFIALVIPFSGWWERVINGFFAIWYLVALGRSFLHIRAGRTALHREWMIRAFAIGLAIATMRLIFIPALIIAGNSTEQQIATLSIISFALAFILHASLAEVWIRSTRKGRVPATEAARDT